MRDDRLMVIYCPVNGVPVLGHVTVDKLNEMVGAPDMRQLDIIPGIVILYDASLQKDPAMLNRSIWFAKLHGNAVIIGAGSRVAYKDIRELRSLTQNDLIRLATRGLINLDELTGALKMEVLSV